MPVDRDCSSTTRSGTSDGSRSGLTDSGKTALLLRRVCPRHRHEALDDERKERGVKFENP